MEGQRSEYRGNKSKVIAMFAEMIEEAFTSSTSPPPPELPDPGDTYVDELISPSAHLSIANSVAPNPDVHRDAYYLRSGPYHFYHKIQSSACTTFLSLPGFFMK